MKEEIAKKIAENLPAIMPHSYQYTTDALDMENTIREKMQRLSYAEFEGVLHPAFEEDEILLIFVGGVLGAIAGAVQLAVFYTWSLLRRRLLSYLNIFTTYTSQMMIDVIEN